MKRILNFIFLLTTVAFAQNKTPAVVFSQTTFNFHKVENWISRIDTIYLTNNSAQKVFLLKQHYPRTFEIRFPAEGIPAGQTRMMEVIYNPINIGKFNASVEVFHTAAVKPVVLKFEGEVLSFDAFSSIACPSFSNPTYKRPEFDIEITVIDSASGKVLPKASVEIWKGEGYTTHQSDASGLVKVKSNIGKHYFYVERAGYESKEAQGYFNPKLRHMTIALVAKDEEKKDIVLPLPKVDKIDKVEKVVVERRPAKMEELPPIDASVFSIANYKENNLVFLIDVSKSMDGTDRLPLLKVSMTALTRMLRPEDKITIITYSDDVLLQLPSTSGREVEKIIAVIQSLKAGGSTAGDQAIRMAYDYAQKSFINGGVNQIVIATDGGFDGLGKTGDQTLALIRKKTTKNLRFSALTFGQNKLGKKFIARLTQDGGGFYLFIENEEQAKINLQEMVKSQGLRK